MIFFLYVFFGFVSWVWEEIFVNIIYVENFMLVNYICFVIVVGIIGIVVGVFIGWYIYFVIRG